MSFDCVRYELSIITCNFYCLFCMSLIPVIPPDVGGNAFSRWTNVDSRSRRRRTSFTGQQLSELERQFQSNKYLTRAMRYEISRNLILSETQVFKRIVYIWTIYGHQYHQSQQTNDRTRQTWNLAPQFCGAYQSKRSVRILSNSLLSMV